MRICVRFTIFCRTRSTLCTQKPIAYNHICTVGGIRLAALYFAFFEGIIKAFSMRFFAFIKPYCIVFDIHY